MKKNKIYTLQVFFLALGGRGERGFTLIELLVVVLIIGILAAVALPQYQKTVMRSRYIQIKTLTRHLADAEEMYYLANGTYVDTFEDLDLSMPKPLPGYTLSSYWIRFKFGACLLGINEDMGYKSNKLVTCTLYEKGTAVMSYTVNLDHSRSNSNRRTCTVRNDSAVARQVCLLETGDTTTTNNNYIYP